METRSDRDRHPPVPAIVSWSGGKDSALALHAALADPSLAVAALVTTVTAGYDRISMHGVRSALLREQAEAIGLPLVVATIPQRASNAVYESAMGAAIRPLASRGVTSIVCGDLFLSDIRKYRERVFRPLGLEPLFPLWGRDTGALAREFLNLGFRATICCVDPAQIAASFCGREFDAALLAELPESADPCGERGEFHTFVHDGPIFRRPIATAIGECVERDGFVFRDILGADHIEHAPLE